MIEGLARLQGALADRYTIERELGQGGMATVYLARDLKHDRQVALKVLRQELTATLGAERFHREIQIAAKLQHPNILPLLDSDEAAGLLYYAMPYVEGQSLRERLAREGALPVPDTVRILRDVVDALTEAHAHGVVHRDIKPENIMLRGRHALVTDFGVAKAVSEATGRQTLTTAGVALGTPAYMAPEQASADPHLDHRVDIYAVGAVAYELLTGRPVFMGTTPQMVLSAHVTDAPQPITRFREAVPRALEALVMRCLAKQPADRWQSAEELLPQLEALATPSGGITPTDTQPVRAARPRRRRLVTIAVAIAVICLAAATFLVLHHRSPALDPKTVVVAPFENDIRDSSLVQLSAIAADWLVQVLQSTGNLKVVPFAEVAATGWTPGKRVQDLATATRAGTVIMGRASLQEDSVYLRADVVDGRTGALLSSLPPVSAARSKPLEAVKELARRATGSVAEIRSPGALGSLAVNIPPSYDAYSELVEAERWYVAGEYRQAWTHAERAYALDTTFLEAILLASDAHGNANDFAKVDSQLRFLDVRRNRLSRSQQLWAELNRTLVLKQDFQRALEFERAFAAARDVNFYDWGYTAVLANRPAEAVHVYADVGRNAPLSTRWVWWWFYFAHAYHMLGRHEDELRVARHGRALFPDQLPAVNAEIDADAALGRQQDVAKLLDVARGLNPSPFDSGQFWNGAGPWQPYEAALEFRAHGFGDAYRWAIQQTLDRLREAAPGDTMTLNWRWGRALALYAAERWQEARDGFAALQHANPKNVDLLGGLGVSEARLGHRAEALTVAARLARLNPPYSFGRSLYWQARIAAVLGDRDATVARLREALAQGMMCLVGVGPPWEDCHRDIDFESVRRYPPFDELLRPKD